MPPNYTSNQNVRHQRLVLSAIMTAGVLSIPLLEKLTGDWMVAAAIGLVGLVTVIGLVSTLTNRNAR